MLFERWSTDPGSMTLLASTDIYLNMREDLIASFERMTGALSQDQLHELKEMFVGTHRVEILRCLMHAADSMSAR